MGLSLAERVAALQPAARKKLLDGLTDEQVEDLHTEFVYFRTRDVEYLSREFVAAVFNTYELACFFEVFPFPFPFRFPFPL